MRKYEMLAFAIVVISFVVGIYLYFQMPEMMASHWNINGNVNGYLPKMWGLFLMPSISFGLLLLFIAIPKIDPLKKNVEKFRKYFDRFVLLIILFLFYLNILTIFWNFGFRFSIVQFLVPAFSALFFYAGILIENSKRNWFIGIRTPWTMSSDRVWEKTHKLGGKLFKISALISLVGLAFESYAFYFLLIPLIFSSVFAVAYSYFEYRKKSRR